MQHGKMYKHGKMGPDTFDCAGLAWYVYYTNLGIRIFEGGIGLSTTTKIMTCKYGNIKIYDNFDKNKNLSLLSMGDIVFLHRQSLNNNYPDTNNKYPGHCGIYLGDNKFIHASKTKGKVVISSLKEDTYWNSVLVGSLNIISEEDKILKRIKKRERHL